LGLVSFLVYLNLFGIKSFVIVVVSWYEKNKILTKDNLRKSGWQEMINIFFVMQLNL
jgi:uncharacterized membrane protein